MRVSSQWRPPSVRARSIDGIVEQERFFWQNGRLTNGAPRERTHDNRSIVQEDEGWVAANSRVPRKGIRRFGFQAAGDDVRLPVRTAVLTDGDPRFAVLEGIRGHAVWPRVSDDDMVRVTGIHDEERLHGVRRRIIHDARAFSDAVRHGVAVGCIVSRTNRCPAASQKDERKGRPG